MEAEMAEVVDELNNLLVRERGEVEALKSLVDHLSQTDPDIVSGAEDALETARWACSGLYHRINQLDGIVTLDSSDLAERVDNEDDTKRKLEIICRHQRQDVKAIKSLLKRDDLDEATRDFLEELLNLHQSSENWCRSVLKEWEPDLQIQDAE